MNEHGPQTPLKVPDARNARYDLSGDFLEACDCFTICPCWTGRAPDEDVCTGVFAWAIKQGTIDGVDVAGQTVVSVSTHEGHRDSGHQRVMLFVGERASADQSGVLAGAFSGRFGGPLGELATLLGELLGAEHAAIDVHWDARRTRLTVGRRIVADAISTVGSTGMVTTLADARLSGVLDRRQKWACPGASRWGCRDTASISTCAGAAPCAATSAIATTLRRPDRPRRCWWCSSGPSAPLEGTRVSFA